MARLSDRGAWDELPPEVLDAFDDLLAEEEFTLEHRRWFTDGRSGEPVACVLRRAPDDSDKLVLKFFDSDSEQRIANTQKAWSASKPFREHLAKVERRTLPLGTWRAIFMRIAGGDLSGFVPLTELFDTDGFSQCCGTIVRSIVRDWNGNRVPTEERTVADVLGDILHRRKAHVERWALRADIAIDGSDARVRRPGWPTSLANPFRLVADTEASRRTHDFIIGKAHGDLNGRNILLRAKPTEADSFVLIDYDRFAERAPLARDPMHLLVTLTLDRLDEFPLRTRQKLARVLVDPDSDDITPRYEHIRKVSAAFHERSAPKTRKGMKAEWRQQCLLSLVGAALMHLGRTIRPGDEGFVAEAKEWCFYLAATAAEAYQRTVEPEERVDLDPAPRPDRSPSALPSEAMVDRKDDLRALQTRLADGPWGVTVLRGARGIGKTKLLDVALDESAVKQAVKSSVRVRRHETSATSRLDTGTLIDYLDGEPDAITPLRYGRSSLVRMESTLRRLGDSPVVIAVDSAENLLDPETRKLLDPDLDEALEMLATRQGHRVTVLLATQREPASPADSTWPEAEAPIFLDKLPFDDFFDHLGRLDADSRWNPAGLPDDARRLLYDKVQGNPRLGELAHAIVTVANTGLNLRSLADSLWHQHRKTVPDYLIGLLLDGLGEVERRVLRALAAFGTPVPATAVTGLLADEPPDKVRLALSTLVTGRIVRQPASDQYFVPVDDGRSIIEHINDEEMRSDLYFFAAEQLTFLQNSDPRGVDDLRVHFAELTALLRAHDHGSAYNMIELIHDVLREWNCEHLLLEQREEVRGKLADEHLEMANHNALADIYTTYGRFEDAASAYERALAIADSNRDDTGGLKIRANLAALYSECNDARALGCLEYARDEARRLNDLVVLMGALEGIADCYRRHGRYSEAAVQAQEALALPLRPDYPVTASARDFAASRSVAITLKLARWAGERGNNVEAARLIEVAKSTAAERGDPWLLTSCLDEQAARLVDQDELELAEVVALKAVEHALHQRDPETLLQARTTLCFTYLKLDRFDHAWSEIELARPYRREGRSLVVLALLALAAHHRRDRLTANKLFRQLLDEARVRIDQDEHDFTAWDFHGYAVCGLHLGTGSSFDEAIVSFRRARKLTTEPTPALVGRLRLMLSLLNAEDRLRRVVEVL